MLKQLRKKFHLIECTVVEPSGEQINSYKKLVEEQKDALSGVTFDWRQETIQEFCKANADGSKKFHFVSAIHSCYFIAKQDLDFYLNTLCEWTKGKILIMIDAETGGFNRLEKKFFGSTHPSKMLPRENSIRESFQSLGVSFETKVIPGECDITSCFESDSRVGKLLLDFLLQRVGCRDDGPPELLKVIKEFLKTEGISHNRNGRIYAAVPTLVIVASTSYGA
ncbi:Histamine N-methyltransferase A [Holothuria leucospilota]|uniref:Histamine N-methyltransferase A n=1 Tax=Holothuria leucospilota TaxID=206669 RepID=A0A9Q1H106_HOLLE|nr:Histamine N-methyltransferase A [Holothuria leucospilota]